MKKSNMWVGLIFIITMIILLTTVPDVLAGHQIKVIVYNPFNIRAKLELKCNWNGKIFRYHKYYRLPKKSKVEIIIPNNSRCQLWPGTN